MSTEQPFVAAARKYLRAGRKAFSVPQTLNLAAQVLAVDLGLKPALLYDSNGASVEQLHQYVNSLQSLQLVSNSLLTLDLNGNSLIVNPATVRSNLEQVRCDSSLAVIDVSHTLEKPAIINVPRGEFESMTQDLLSLLGDFQRLREAEKPLCVGEKCEEWNLCTAFGLLLGYPVTYWFDQNKSFENCLSMTPLMVIIASATWQESHRCCLYSFSIPEALHGEMQSKLENWKLSLQERFEQQSIFKDLSISQSIVTLPSVCL